MELKNLEHRVTEEHDLFMLALNGQYLGMLKPGAAPTPKDVVDFAAAAARMRAALRGRVNDDVDELLTSFESTYSDAAVETMRSLTDAFKAEFSRITLENIQTVITALRVGRDDLGKMFTRALGGAMGELLVKRVQKVEFKVSDPAGRKWDSGRWMAFTAREFAYRLKLTMQLDNVGELAEVFYPDHDSDGMVFVAHGEARGTYPAFKDIEKTVFHPNSKAEVVKHA